MNWKKKLGDSDGVWVEILDGGALQKNIIIYKYAMIFV